MKKCFCHFICALFLGSLLQAEEVNQQETGNISEGLPKGQYVQNSAEKKRFTWYPSFSIPVKILGFNNEGLNESNKLVDGIFAVSAGIQYEVIDHLKLGLEAGLGLEAVFPFQKGICYEKEFPYAPYECWKNENLRRNSRYSYGIPLAFNVGYELANEQEVFASLGYDIAGYISGWNISIGYAFDGAYLKAGYTGSFFNWRKAVKDPSEASFYPEAEPVSGFYCAFGWRWY